MFQFGGFPTCNYVFITRSMILHHSGFPIRKSAGRGLFAAHRSLSQLVTSFVGSWCQGIRPVLFIAWTSPIWITWVIVDNRLNLFNSTMKVPLFFPPFIGEIVVSQLYRKTCIFFNFAFWFILSCWLSVRFTLHLLYLVFNDHKLSLSGGLKWTRTTDLALIRRAL